MYRRALMWFAATALATGTLVILPATAAGSTGTREISISGTTSLGAPLVGSDAIQVPEIGPGVADAAAAGQPAQVPSLGANRSESSGHDGEGAGANGSNEDSSNSKLLASFDGLNHRQQRLANGGNQFSLEPPDQGLCTGNGFVMETVNDVIAVYDHAGNMLAGPIDQNTFYGYPAAINRTTGVRGQFVTDPSCYFDKATQRWFHVVLTLDTFPNGVLTGSNHLDLAISQTSSPLGGWNLYKIPVQDDGTSGTQDHHCSTGPNPVAPTNPNACLGDYPHIGADANGFYVTTNEYSFFGPEFKAAQIYVFSKKALASGAAIVLMDQINTLGMVGGSQAGFTVWPAEAANGHFNNSHNGTEFFMSSNAADEVNPTKSRTSTDLVVWALTNTASLNGSFPNVSISNTVLTVGRYSVPPKSNQKVGPTPLRDCVNDVLHIGCWGLFFASAPPPTEVESTIDSNDTRMQQVMYANGMLFGALDTALKVNGKTQAGIEWFEVRASVGQHGVHGFVARQGYVGKADTNLTYPALGVNQEGQGVMAFTLLGSNDYPSAAYASFDAEDGVGSIHIAAAGLGPDDGFTSYAAFVGSPPRTRWGDYGAAVIEGSHVWIASEYIGQTCTLAQALTAPLFSCGGTRTSLGNWDTRISEVSLSD